MSPTERTMTIEYDNVELELLPILKKRVFHITPLSGFEKIKNDRVLKSNKDGSLGYNFSEQSYGRKRGYICLFDLRNKTEYEINNALDCWYFLSPDTFGNNIVFLFPDKTIQENLIPYEKCLNETGCTYSELCIRYVECWHDGDINLNSISETLTVNIINRPGNDFCK